MTKDQLDEEIEKVKEFGLGIEQVALALQKKLSGEESVNVIYQNFYCEDAFLNGEEENDLSVISSFCSTCFEIGDYSKIICAPYGTKYVKENGEEVAHMRALALIDQKFLIVYDSDPLTDQQINKAELAEKFNIDEENIIKAISIGGLGFQENNWECGIYSYLKIIEIVKLFKEFNQDHQEITDFIRENQVEDVDIGEKLDELLVEILTNYDMQISPSSRFRPLDANGVSQKSSDALEK